MAVLKGLGLGALKADSYRKIQLVIAFAGAAVAILILGGAVPNVPRASQVATAQHVLIISIDGLRPEALLQATTPNMDLLIKNGAFSSQAQTVVPSITLPSHASMLSGVTIEKHGITWNSFKPELGFIEVPTVFSEAKAQGMTTAMFVGKFKLQNLAAPGTVDTFLDLGEDDLAVANSAADHLIASKPNVLFVHLAETDSVGHIHGWMSSQQLATIAQADQAVGILTGALELAGILDNTLIIVTSDHGGLGRTHGSPDPLDTTIPWIAFGPRIKSGHNIEVSIQTMDTAATALKTLGVSIPTSWDGAPVLGAFEPDAFPTPTPILSLRQWGLIAMSVLMAVVVLWRLRRLRTVGRQR